MASIEEKFNAAIRQINAQRTGNGSLSGRRNLSIEDKFNNAIRQITERDNQQREDSRMRSATSYTWQGHEQAERDFDAWAPRIEEMDTSLANREKILNGYVERLQALQEEPYSQSNAYKYRAMYDNYEKALREYNDMVRERNALSGRMGSALEQYRSWSGGQDAQAETYRQEAAALDERNAELDREMRNYALVNTPFGLENAGPYQAMQEEYDANAARAAELRRMADEAQWQYYGGLRLNEDWDEHQNVLTVAEMADRGYITESPYYDGSLVYEYINDINNRRDMMHGYDASGTRYEAYSKMTPDEIAVYNYIYSAQGPEAAETYLSRLRNELNTRLGTENYEEMGGLGKALYWIPAGFDRFAQGLRQLGKEEAVPVTPMTVTSSLIQQEAQETSPALGGLYDLGANITNMVPSLLASVLTGGAFGAAAGSALLGASAGGNTYADVMRDPERQYSAQQARDYATLVGVSEGALSYLLGGISRLGGVSTRQVLTKLGGLDNALGRIARSSAAPYVMSMISEGTEEGIQELLEPAFATLILGTEYDANFGDAAYAFLLGALTAGIVEGADIGVSGVYNAATRRSNPTQVSFADMDNYLGEDGRDWFEGAADRAALDRRFQELAESEEGESLSDAAWENITKQYNMARAFLDGRETAQNVRSGGAAQTVQEAQEAASAPQAAQAAEAAQAAQEATQTVQAEREAAQTVQPRAAELTPDGGIVLPDVDDGGGVILPDAEQLERNERAANAATELERSGILAGVSDEDIGTAQRLSNLLNRPVVFYDGAQESGAFGAANGYFADDTIHVNSRSNNPVAQIIAHELTHSIEGADSYSRLRQYTLGYLRERGEDIDALRARKRDIYARNGVQLDDTAIDQEIVAEFVEHYLLADEESIRRLVTRDRTLGQRILDWINRVLEWLGVSNRHTREYQLLKRARDAYARALRETESRRQRATAEQTLEGAGEDYVSGEISDEEFDASMDAVTEQESLAGTEQLDVTRETEPRYSFAGRNAANADLEALDAAEEMERRDVDAETIRQQTGWFRGRDGKWRFEIDDSGMEYRREGDANLRRESGYQRLTELTGKWEASMSGGEALTESERAEMDRLEEEYGERVYEERYLLSDFIEHSELYDNYPQLRYTSLAFDELPDGTSGYYNYEDGAIHLSNKFIGEPRDVLIHEIQHAIQRYEGFTRGASPEYWARREYESGDLVEERLRRERDSVFNSLSRAEQNKYNRYRELDMALNQTMFAEPGTEEAVAYQRYEAEQDTLYEELYPNEWFRQLLDLERRIENVPVEYARMYRNTAGEIEARDAAARRRLTAEERRATPPDLGDENTVFADDEIPVKARFSLDEEEAAWDETAPVDAEGNRLSEQQREFFANSEVRLEPDGTYYQGQGRLLPVYHSTYNDFTVFDFNRLGENTDYYASDEWFGAGSHVGFWFNTQDLSGRAGTRTEKVYLNIQNIYALNSLDELASAIYNHSDSGEMTASEAAEAFRAELEAEGYDGLLIYNDDEFGGMSFVAFHPEQIKRTTNANPTNSEDIRYSISDPERRRDVMAQLRRYVGGDITSAELNNYLNGQTRAVNEEAGAAQDIIDRAHADGMSVDEFLRYNWEEFEADGVLNEDAQRALDLERLGAARRYGVADPERVNVLPGNVDVVQNATPGEYRRMRNASYIDYPWLMETGDSPVAQLQGGDGNTYTWREDQMSDEDVGYYMDTALEPRFSIDEDAPAEAPDALTQEYNELVASLPNKARPFLRRAENQLLDAVSKAFGVPYAAKRDSLRPVVQEITLEYMLTGTVSTETVDELFERAYEAGVVINREYYDQYKDVLDYLKNTQLRVSQDIVGDIPDFEDFRKANFGRLRISTREGSSNVDQVFMEMAERWPELFDAQRYIVPSDQLLRISSVANGIRIAETSLDRALGRGAAEFREESRRELDALLGESIGALRNVRRSAADEAARRAENEGSAPNMPQSQQEAAALWQELKQLRRDFERARARTLLTRADNEAISQLMSGQTTLQNLNPDEYNIEGIRAVYAAKRAYEDVAIQLRRWNQARRSRLYEQADGMLENSGEWKDKRAGALYSRETMERNIRDIVTDQADADAIIETYFRPVHEATAEGNRIKNRYRDRVRELKLSRRVAEGNVVSEAHAVQLLGEAEDNIDFLLRSRGRVRERDGKSLEDWRGIVQNLWRENPKLDEAKIRSAVSEFRRIYDELFEQMNEVRVRNGYEPVNYRRGYFPHFQPGDGDGIISQFGRALGIDTKVTALPTSINGLTHAFRPGITWFGNAMERLGFNTAYDAVEGFDRYIEGVTDVITQTDNIQRLRALANRIRYNTTDEGMRAQIDQILNDPTLKEEDKQNRLKDLYEKGRFTLSNFVVDLEEYTNLLANKKSRRDRDVEQDVGRGIYNIMRTVSGRVAANLVAINPSSWLTNLVPLTQGWAQLGSGRLLKGMWETLRSYKEDDGIIDKSTFLTNRQGSDPIVRVWEQGAEPEGSVKRAVRTAGRVSGQLGEILSSPMQLIDMFVSGSLVRAKYQQNLGKGMSEEAAMADADQFAANVIADRSKGAQPTRFGRRNPLAQVFNQFQLEVNNQLSYIFKDVPRETRAAGVRALAMAMLKFFFGALLYNEAYELIFGRRPALDVFGLLNDTVGDIFGWEVPNLLELGWGLASGNVPSFETEAAGLLEAGFNFVGNAAEQLPFVGGIIGGGRLPISSALPDMYNLLNAALGEDLAPEYRRQEILDELNAPFSYVVMPFGGSIMNRIFDSVKAAINGGVYTYNSEGERLLQYPVYNEDAGDVAETILRGGMFGLTTYGTGREWVEEGFPTLTADQTAAYQGMIDAGVRGEDAYDLIGDIRDADSSAAKRYAITQADISGEGKSVAYYALLASDDERETMDELAGMGADMGAVAEAMIGVKNGRELEGPKETEMKLKAIREAELSQDGKYVLYRDLISENQEEDINAFLDAGLSFDSYLEAREQYARIEQDAESSEERALRFAEWVESQSVTSEQAEVMRDTIAPLRGNIGKLAGAGMDLEAASEIDEAIDGLGEDASSTEKYMAIAELPISEAEKDMALEGIMSESAYAKYAAAREAGIDTYDYCAFLDHIAGISGDGRQERIWAYIDAMPLTDAQKDTLHLAAGYKESTLGKAPWRR